METFAITHGGKLLYLGLKIYLLAVMYAKHKGRSVGVLKKVFF